MKDSLHLVNHHLTHTSIHDFSIGGMGMLSPRHSRGLLYLYIPIGVIGTGLFLGTAAGLQTGGPVGLLLAYMVVRVRLKEYPPLSVNMFDIDWLYLLRCDGELSYRCVPWNRLR